MSNTYHPTLDGELPHLDRGATRPLNDVLRELTMGIYQATLSPDERADELQQLVDVYTDAPSAKNKSRLERAYRDFEFNHINGNDDDCPVRRAADNAFCALTGKESKLDDLTRRHKLIFWANTGPSTLQQELKHGMMVPVWDRYGRPAYKKYDAYYQRPMRVAR